MLRQRETDSIRVLVVDDQQTLRETLWEMLEDFAYDVDTAVDGEQAIVRYNEFRERAYPEGRPGDVAARVRVNHGRGVTVEVEDGGPGFKLADTACRPPRPPAESGGGSLSFRN